MLDFISDVLEAGRRFRIFNLSKGRGFQSNGICLNAYTDNARPGRVLVSAVQTPQQFG